MRRVERDVGILGLRPRNQSIVGQAVFCCPVTQPCSKESLIHLRLGEPSLIGMELKWFGCRAGRQVIQAASTSELLCNFEEVMVKKLGPKCCVFYLFMLCWVFLGSRAWVQ